MDIETVVNEEALRETKQYLVPKGMKTLMKIFIIFYVIVGTLAMFGYGQIYVAAILFGLSAISVAIYVYSADRMVKLNMKHLKNLTGSDSVRSKITFLEDRALFYGVTGKKTEVLYPEFMIFGETENYYVLYTRTFTGGIIEKEGLDDEKKEKFLEIVEKTNCKK